MNSTEFWALIDFLLDMVAEFFTLMNNVVVIDSPRFSLFDFLIAVIFVGLLISTINWLRGIQNIRIHVDNTPDVMHPEMQNYRPPGDNMSREMWEYGKK